MRIEEIEDLREVLEGRTHVVASCDLDITMLHFQLFHPRHPASRCVDQAVTVSLYHDHWDSPRFDQTPAATWTGWRERRQRRPDVGVFHRQVPGAPSSHGVTHQVDLPVSDHANL